MSSQIVSTTCKSKPEIFNNVVTMMTGMITLVAVMGIGRFSLTPQIPLMIHDGIITLSSAGLLAAMNYVGYLLGALHASRIRTGHAYFLKVGLLATVLVTILSGLTSSFMLQCLFRFVSGVGGAWALILVTSWTQMVLSSANAPRMSAAVFTGPGVGITLTGLLAWIMSAEHLNSSQAWYVYGVIALLAAAVVFRKLPGSLPSSTRTDKPVSVSRNMWILLGTYTLAGFGYILPATFLSQMAHSVFTSGSGSAFFWPLFGLSAVTGVLVVITVSHRVNTKSALALAMIMQGVGVAISVLMQGAAGLLISTILTGLGFLSIMQLSMRLAREISTVAVARTVGMLTAGYATGQLIGPLVSTASVKIYGSLSPALMVAAVGLIIGGLAVKICIRFKN